MLSGEISEGSSCIMDVNAEGMITVLTGDGKELSAGSAYTGAAGIS